jgi:hypothetical protein
MMDDGILPQYTDIRLVLNKGALDLTRDNQTGHKVLRQSVFIALHGMAV